MDGIRISILAQDEKKNAGNRTHNPEILKACDRALYFMNKRTAEDFGKGLKCFNEAIEADPVDPLPYLGLGLGLQHGRTLISCSTDASSLASGMHGVLKKSMPLWMKNKKHRTASKLPVKIMATLYHG